jgi:hypothetical protein
LLAAVVLVAVAIIAIGVMYILQPRVMTRNFGLPIPEEGSNITWWLRLKGSRDIVSGLVVLATTAWGSTAMLGMILLVEAIIPVGDMGLILAAKGSTRTALGVHGLTAVVMISLAVPLLLPVA